MYRFVSALSRINSGSIFKQWQSQSRAIVLLRTRPLSVSSARHGSAGEGLHRTSQFDKKILVWTKMFPRVADVPDEVTEVKMKKAKDLFRIRVSLLMAVATMGLCVVYVWSGKLAVGRGENIHQINRDRHHEFQKKD